jgi:hypothetical protein
LIHLDAASGENASQQFGDVMPLSNGDSACGAGFIQAVAPEPAASRLLDAKKGAPRPYRQCR